MKKIVGSLVLLICSGTAYGQDMSGWSDKTICRLFKDTSSEVYLKEGINRNLSCVKGSEIVHSITTIGQLNSMGFLTQVYSEIEGDVLNPDRGYFHSPVGNHKIPKTSMIRSPSMNPSRNPNSQTLRYSSTVYRIYFSLKGFESGEISDVHLRKLEGLLEAARMNGVTLIPRFYYLWGREKSVTPSEKIINRHVEQVSNVINNYVEQISFIEVGFIGAWGEWHSDQYGSQNRYHPYRKKLVKKMLDELDPRIKLALRYASDRRRLGNIEGIDRVGLHHDCPNYSSDIYPKFRGWELTIKLPQGGEVCKLKPKTSYSCDVMLKYFDKYNFDVLNASDWSGSNSRFLKEGCLKEIRNRLGYRFVLRGSKYKEGVLSIAIENVGFGKRFKPSNVSIKVGEKKIDTKIDAQNWLKGVIHVHDIEVGSIDFKKDKVFVEIEGGIKFANKTGNEVILIP